MLSYAVTAAHVVNRALLEMGSGNTVLVYIGLLERYAFSLGEKQWQITCLYQTKPLSCLDASQLLCLELIMLRKGMLSAESSIHNTMTVSLLVKN